MSTDFRSQSLHALQADPDLRTTLLDFFVQHSSALQLRHWLTSLGLDTQGTSAQHRARLRSSSRLVTMPPAQLPRLVLRYLLRYGDEQLTRLCEQLNLPAPLEPDAKRRRILRYVGVRERWLPPPLLLDWSGRTLDHVRPFIDYHRIPPTVTNAATLVASLEEDLVEVFGRRQVHSELTVGRVVTETVTWQIGPASSRGVGVIVVRPRSSVELNALRRRVQVLQGVYGRDLLVVLRADRLSSVGHRRLLAGLRETQVSIAVK